LRLLYQGAAAPAKNEPQMPTLSVQSLIPGWPESAHICRWSCDQRMRRIAPNPTFSGCGFRSAARQPRADRRIPDRTFDASSGTRPCGLPCHVLAQCDGATARRRKPPPPLGQLARLWCRKCGSYQQYSASGGPILDEEFGARVKCSARSVKRSRNNESSTLDRFAAPHAHDDGHTDTHEPGGLQDTGALRGLRAFRMISSASWSRCLSRNTPSR
jgi:hypothetical protein